MSEHPVIDEAQKTVPNDAPMEATIPLTLDNAPDFVAMGIGVPFAIVIGRLPNGDIMVNHNLPEHRQVVEALAVAIHAVMSQHDEQILAGRAGAAAQKRFEDMRNLSGATDVSLPQ